jgi:hypothetical protein
MKYIVSNPKANNGGAAGIGHQFSNFLVPYTLAKKYNLKFVYQPFQGETDGTFDRKGTNFYQITTPVKAWNDFLNFHEGELATSDVPKGCKEIELPWLWKGKTTWDDIKFAKLIQDPGLNQDLDVLFRVSSQADGQFIDIDWDIYENNDLKRKYNNSKQVKNFKCYFDKDTTNIGIHIRRGDVTEANGYRRWMGLDHYFKIIENLSNMKELQDITFHIYVWDMLEKEKRVLSSHRLPDKRQIKLHIDEDVFSTFYHLVASDIFVSGQGSFSLLVNYLTDAIKLTTPWKEDVSGKSIVYWDHFPDRIKEIVPVSSDGSFDILRLLGSIRDKNEKT